MKKITLLFTIFCLVSTFSKAQNSCNSCRTSNKDSRCRVHYTSDIPLTTATQEQLNEINQIYNRLSDRILGEVENKFMQRKIDRALSNYNELNIRVVNGNISGDIIDGIRDPNGMIKIFAQYIKFRPTAPDVEDIKQKASNVVWLILKKNCDGSLPIVSYEDYREFMKPVTFLLDYISDDSKIGFYNLMTNFNGLGAFRGVTRWSSNYSTGDGIFSADMMRSSGISLTGYAKHLNDDEKVRWMKGITRLMNRSFTYSKGGSNGIKPDGSGFHHLFSYPTYMGASYTTCIDIIVSLDKTSFKISRDSYLRFRDAVYYQRIIGNDAGIKASSMSGRFPQGKTVGGANIQAIGDLAIIGGKILGLTTADPVLAGYLNRITGITNPEFNYTEITPFEEGYIQFNHTEAGIYRKDNYLVFFKGFSSSTIGIEGFEGNNLFGRYQSYGAMEIVVPGGTDAEDNGFSTSTWNWNYNPGATTIVLSWENLKKRQNYGSQQKRFVGSLSLKNKGNLAFTKIFGTYGLFAMDFQEDRNKNPTFIFKKSNFTFSDMIVCLGSGINNNNTNNNTVTTLYQRLANSRDVTVNGTVVQEEGLQTFTGNNNWVISNANNGFYVVNGGDIKVWSGSLATANHKSDPSNITLTTDLKPNTYGYIDHGTGPNNVGYEYICTPKTTVEKMTALHTKMQDSNNLPYIVHQKNANAHIVEHKKDKIWAYSLFSRNSNINHTGSIIKKNNKPCLVMYQKTDINNIILSVTNPNWGFDGGWGGKSNAPIVPIDMQLTLSDEWLLSSPNPGVKLISSNASKTVLEFNLIDGLPVEVQIVKANKVLVANAGDEDGDGVFDNVDQCNNTPSGESINAVGCVQISSNNFEIFSTTSKCPNVNNGKINIKNSSSHMFNFVITGPDSYNNTFENKSGGEPFVIEDLAVGTYNIIAKFSADGIGEDITGFNITINDATLVSGVNKSVNRIRKSSVFTVSGDKKYSIFVNDIFQRSETFSDESEYEITVDNLSVGENHIKIIPENICRGLIEDWITIPNSNIKFSPNPAVDLFHIGGLNSPDITVQIFTYNGQLVYNKNHKPVNRIVYFSMRDLSAGFYIVRVSGKKTGDNINFKITKK